MEILLLFSFLAGVVTILSPCIFPLLPIILSSSLDNSGIRRPIGVVVGFIASFSFFTLTLAALVEATGVDTSSIRGVSSVIIALFGLSLVSDKFQVLVERFFTNISGKFGGGPPRHGFWGGLALGLSLGLIWTPCVGPILASVITLAITGQVNGASVLVTLSYSMGTAIPMFAIIIGGQKLMGRVSFLKNNSRKIQKGFGYLMIALSILLLFGVEKRFSQFVLENFPAYAEIITKVDSSTMVEEKIIENLN
jgi:cytochrome c biogenesis protein CcdA